MSLNIGQTEVIAFAKEKLKIPDKSFQIFKGATENKSKNSNKQK